MPVTLQPTTLKYKNGNTFVAADCLKGDQGSPGDPTQLIDDTAGSGDTGKVWSADKTSSEVGGVKDRVGALEPAASATDIGKALIVKTVSDGKATSYEFGTAADPTSVIDDNAGPFSTDKTFSASKLWSDLGGKVSKSGAQFNDISMGRVPNSTVGNQSIAIGTSDNPNQGAIASGDNSVAVGTYVQATGNRAIAIGGTTQATGLNATAIGGSVTASGDFSFSHGSSTSAQGINSTAEGYGTTASGIASHAGGSQTFAVGDYSHSQGYGTRANGDASSVEGNGTVANGANSSVSGMYNVPDSYANWPDWAPNTYYAAGAKVHLPDEEPDDPRGEYFVCNTSHTSGTAWITYSFYWDSDNGKMNYAQIVGNGSNYLQQSNAYTLDWNGNGSYAGDVTINKGTAEEVSVSALKTEINHVFDDEVVSPVTPSQNLPNNYIFISSSATADAYWSDGDAYFVDIDDCGEVLTFGIDLTATYPGDGQAVIIFSNSCELGGSAPNYYSKSNFVNGHSSFATRGIDISHKNDGYITIDIDTLKASLPYVEGIAINFPTGSYLLQCVFAKATKYVKFLRIANTVPALIVAADGSGDYTTISAAVAAAKDEDTIFIKDGTYTETVVVKKFLHLVGQSKQGTILQQNVGDYNNCPLCITQGSVCNLTIKSLAPADTSGLTDYAYALHLDKNFASLAKYQRCEIWNCDIFSEVNDAIGAGTNYASEYDIHDCFIHVAHNPVKAGACGLKCHNGQNQTTGKVTLKNNVIITEDANGTSCYDILYHNGGISNIQPIEILQVGNVLKYYHNGITGIFVPSAYNYGNSVAEMNTLS